MHGYCGESTVSKDNGFGFALRHGFPDCKLSAVFCKKSVCRRQMPSALHIAHDGRLDRNAGVGLQDGDELTAGIGQIDMVADDGRMLAVPGLFATCHVVRDRNLNSFRHNNGQRIWCVCNPVADGGQIERNLRNENHVNANTILSDREVCGMDGNQTSMPSHALDDDVPVHSFAVVCHAGNDFGSIFDCCVKTNGVIASCDIPVERSGNPVELHIWIFLVELVGLTVSAVSAKDEDSIQTQGVVGLITDLGIVIAIVVEDVYLRARAQAGSANLESNAAGGFHRYFNSIVPDETSPTVFEADEFCAFFPGISAKILQGGVHPSSSAATENYTKPFLIIHVFKSFHKVFLL